MARGAHLHLTSAAAVATALAFAATPPPPHISLLLHSLDETTEYGDVAVGLPAPDDPVFMAQTWVYGEQPVIRAIRPKAGEDWKYTTVGAFPYESLRVTSTGTVVANGSAAVDTVVLWNQTPVGVAGTCALVGLRSATDGTVAAAFVIDYDNNSVSVSVLDGETGEVKWTQAYTPGNPPGIDMLAYGVRLSRDGKWLVFDMGLEGLGLHHFFVVSTADGTARGAAGPVDSASVMQTALSGDGAYLFIGGPQDFPRVSLMQWKDEGAGGGGGAYVQVASSVAPLPPASTASSWFMLSGGFTTDAGTNRTYLAVGWYGTDLHGDVSVGVWDVADVGAGPVAAFTQAGIPGNDYAISQVGVSCADSLCSVALQTQVQGGSAPTVVLLDCRGAPGEARPPVFSYTTPGSMNSVRVVRGGAAFYVAVAGCTSVGDCIESGAEGYMWEVTLA